MTNEELNAKILRELMTARLNEIYYRNRSGLFGKLDLGLRIAVAVFSTTGAVGAILSKQLPVGLWLVVSVLAAVAAIASPILRFGEESRKAGDLAARWTTLAGALRDLDISEGDDSERFGELRKLMRDGSANETLDVVQPKRKVVEKIQKQVIDQFADRLDLPQVS